MSRSSTKKLLYAFSGCFALSAIIATVGADAQSRNGVINSIGFEEDYDPNPVVSGPSLFMALYDDSSKPDRFTTDIEVTLEATGRKKICLKGLSRDGKYSVNASYDIETLSEGLHALEFPTKYETTLSRYGQYDVALSIWFADDCKSRIDEIELLSYNTGERTDFRVLIQSRGGKSFVANENDDMISECKSIADTPTVKSIAYDKFCHVEGDRDDTLRIDVLDYFGEPVARQKFRIASGQ